MQRLNKGQIEYATKRINAAASKKKGLLKNKLTTGKPLTSERRAALLRQGKVKLQKGVADITRYTNVLDVFDFSEFGERLDEKKYIDGCDKINDEMGALMDELMLGDTERALEIIAGLCKQ